MKAQRAYAAGRAAKAEGRFDEAIAQYRRALRLAPGQAEFHVSLGLALRAAGRLAEARAALERAVGLAPAMPEAHHNLGNLLAVSGELERARACYERALAAAPQFAEARFELGNVLREQGRLEQAIACYEAAIAAKPGFAPAWRGLGVARQELRELAAALAAYERALELEPHAAQMHVNLSSVNRELSRVERALAHAHRAVELDERLGAAHNNLGTLHLDIGEHAAADACYRRALELEPANVGWRSNLCMLTTYATRYGPADALEAHREYGRVFAPVVPRHPNRRDPGRRLRVGYVSPDLRQHPVAHFAEPLLARHDRGGFEIFGYYTHRVGDDVTLRLRGYCDRWIEAPLMSAAELAERVRADRIDLLVDLSGHTAGNRLAAFALKPAPVQLTWLGYVTTTGLPAMDYRITDRWIDPLGDERHSTERLLRLEGGPSLCYRAPQASPPVAPLPAAARGHVTFGSFNGVLKLTDRCIALWARLLDAVPGARLVLKSRVLDDPFVRERVAARLAEAGLAGRVELRGPQGATEEHLAQYADVDIALDTAPFNGVTTTCEALWMGVPVLSLAGDTHASRQGRMLLAAAGLPELAPASDTGFVAAGTMLAADLDRLAAVRAGLRARLAGSALMDEAAFARRMEQAYRAAWTRWCEEGA